VYLDEFQSVQDQPQVKFNKQGFFYFSERENLIASFSNFIDDLMTEEDPVDNFTLI